MIARLKLRPRRRRLVIGTVVLLLGTFGLFLWRNREPSREESVAILLRQLSDPPGWGHGLHSNLWRKLPGGVANEFPNFAPVPFQSVRRNALEELAHLAPRSDQAVDVLVSLLDEPALSAEATKALEAIGPFAYRSIDKLVELSHRAGPNGYGLEKDSLSALIAIAPHDQRVFDTLLARIKPPAPSPWIAADLLERCAHLFDHGMQQALLRISEDHPDLRRTLFRAIAMIEPGSSETIAFLLAALSGNTRSSPSEALQLLVEAPRSDPQIIARLHEIVRDAPTDPPMRHQASLNSSAFARRPLRRGTDLAVRALGRIGPAAAAAEPLLRSRLSASDEYLRLESSAALYCIAGDFAPAEKIIAELLQSPDEYTREAALVRLNEIASPAAIPLLRSALASQEKRIRHKSLLILGRLGSAASNAVPDLLPLLSDPSHIIRLDTTNLLNILRGEHAAAVLNR